MLNQLQNRRVHTLRETQPVALTIVTLWYIFMWIGRVVSIQILLSQIDFLVVVLFVDVCTTLAVTKFYYLRQKHTGVPDSHASLLANGGADPTLHGIVRDILADNVSSVNSHAPIGLDAEDRDLERGELR
eukprot:TRINITY_DN3546_c0_g3_i5.p2 TRINITY_DN3546_c0_g3~~TRINITY_DN3546_c0_g3_i5.p2  ORF type:complete len:130 (-),score=37.30 TRINITY_DN3546_c0_g3_i5:63-452(-)